MGTLIGAPSGEQEFTSSLILFDKKRFTDSNVDSIPRQGFIKAILVVDRFIHVVGGLLNRFKPFALVEVLIPGIEATTLLISVFDHVTEAFIASADQPFDVADRGIVVVHPSPFDPGKNHLFKVEKLILCFFGIDLTTPLKGSVGFRDKGTDVDIHIQLCFIPNSAKVIDDLLVLLFAIDEG